MTKLLLVEKTATTRKEIACGTDRNDLALIAQCEFLHSNVLSPLVRDGRVRIDDDTTLEIEEEETMDVQTALERMKPQSDEFDAMSKLADAWRAITMTPIVDDDYPEVRHRYEGALRDFLRACKANGRTMT
jgi:hypothetical protein